jgi:hypothetical protein
MNISLTCPAIAACSGPTVPGNAGNWAGVGLGDGAWPTNFHGWAINGAISTFALWTASTPVGASLSAALAFTPVANPGANDIVATGAVSSVPDSNMNANGFINATVQINARNTNPASIMSAYNSATTHIKGFYQLSAAS